MLKSRAPKASPVLSRSGIAMWFSPQTEAKTTSELSVHLKRKSLKPNPNKHKDIKQQPVHTQTLNHSLLCPLHSNPPALVAILSAWTTPPLDFTELSPSAHSLVSS